MSLNLSVLQGTNQNTGVAPVSVVKEPKANLTSIFGSALFGVASDLADAKESGQQLPGLLDKIATVSLDARNQGIDLAKEEAKSQAIKYAPFAVAGVLLIIVIILVIKISK